MSTSHLVDPQTEAAIDTLRFTTAGSVDDGKSTLIGRLLYDSKSILEDQIAAIARTTSKRGQEGLDLSLLTDGLSAEREQGITIDVAYRYFATPRRRFIIADTPGHEQYTRNMVTGASTADVAIVLIDAAKGIQPQSRRHAALAVLLDLPQVVVAVNKMDLVGYKKEVFQKIKTEFTAIARELGVREISFIPVSALQGDMVVNRGVVAGSFWRTAGQPRLPGSGRIRPHQCWRSCGGAAFRRDRAHRRDYYPGRQSSISRIT